MSTTEPGRGGFRKGKWGPEKNRKKEIEVVARGTASLWGGKEFQTSQKGGGGGKKINIGGGKYISKKFSKTGQGGNTTLTRREKCIQTHS